jgi:hypothetical protein
VVVVEQGTMPPAAMVVEQESQAKQVVPLRERLAPRNTQAKEAVVEQIL